MIANEQNSGTYLNWNDAIKDEIKEPDGPSKTVVPLLVAQL